MAPTLLVVNDARGRVGKMALTRGVELFKESFSQILAKNED